MLPWENEEEEPEESLRDHQVEEGHREEEDLRRQEELQTNWSPQPQTLKQWEKTPLPSMEIGARLTPS